MEQSEVGGHWDAKGSTVNRRDSVQGSSAAKQDAQFRTQAGVPGSGTSLAGVVTLTAETMS